MLLQTGLRLSEVTGLALPDLHLPKAITIRSSREGRVIPVNSKAYEALHRYLSVRPASGSPNVFLNSRGLALGNRGVEKIMHGYFAKAGISGATVHTLRHTFATHHVAKGTSLKTVQEIIGLSDIRTAEVYKTLAKDLARQQLQDNAL